MDALKNRWERVAKITETAVPIKHTTREARNTLGWLQFAKRRAILPIKK